MSVRVPSQFEAVIVAVAAGQSIADAARLVGVNARTAYRWSRETTFKQRIKAIQAESVMQAMTKLSAGMSKAADRLVKLLDSPNEKIALSAALGLLDKAVKLREQFDLRHEIDELRAILETSSPAVVTDDGDVTE